MRVWDTVCLASVFDALQACPHPRTGLVAASAEKRCVFNKSNVRAMGYSAIFGVSLELDPNARDVCVEREFLESNGGHSSRSR